MSRHTTPTGEVTTPIRRGQRGNGRLRAVLEQPLGRQLGAQLPRSCWCRSPAPAGVIDST